MLGVRAFTVKIRGCSLLRSDRSSVRVSTGEPPSRSPQSPPGSQMVVVTSIPLPSHAIPSSRHLGESTMRFLGKYELLEQLTVGKVETFAAYPIGGGERLLVHLFALPALIKSAPTNRDLVGYMETMSPRALGTVLDAGRYDDGSQAFVVVKLPRDPAALSNWVEAYKALAKAKHDTTAEVVAESLWEEGRGQETQEIRVPVKPPGEFTRAFQATAPPKAPEKPSPSPAAHQEPAPQPLPTVEFFVPETVRSP